MSQRGKSSQGHLFKFKTFYRQLRCLPLAFSFGVVDVDCAALFYWTHNGIFGGKTIIIGNKQCTTYRAFGLCERQIGNITSLSASSYL